jgi:hypothetical protein
MLLSFELLSTNAGQITVRSDQITSTHRTQSFVTCSDFYPLRRNRLDLYHYLPFTSRVTNANLDTDGPLLSNNSLP